MRFNIGKCNGIVFGGSIEGTVPLYIGNDQLKQVTSVKHIGHVISNERDLVQFESIRRQIPEKSYCVNRTFHILYAACKSTLFKSQCCSLYGIELLDLMSDEFQKIQVQWRKSIRHMINLHPRTHNRLLPHVINGPNVESVIYCRMICFAKKGLIHDNGLISFFFKNCLTNMHSYMSRNINVILRKLNIKHNEMLTRSEAWLKRRCKATPAPDWRARMVCELIQCREGSLQCNLDAEQIRETRTYLCIE